MKEIRSAYMKLGIKLKGCQAAQRAGDAFDVSAETGPDGADPSVGLLRWWG